MVAFALVLEGTEPFAPGLDPDALAYLGSAESLAAHGELRAPMSSWWSADSTSPLAHFPPGYVAAIAVPVRLGMEAVQGARLVGALSAFVTIATLVLLVSDVATPLAGVLLAVTLFAMSSMHEVHVSVLSEPLYLAFEALTLAAMVRRPRQPLLAGLGAALGALTRYAGVSLIGAVALWSMAQRGTLSARLRRSLTAVAPALVLQLLWVLRTRRVAGAGSIRELALYGDLGPTLKQGAETLEAWLVPNPEAWEWVIPHRGALTITAALLLCIVTVSGARRFARRGAGRAEREEVSDADEAREPGAMRLLGAAALLIACYLAVLIVSRVVADPGIPFDERIFSPVILLATTMAAVGVALWWRSTPYELPKLAMAGALIGWWMAAASVTADEARYALESGSDFAGEEWRRSELLDWARTNGMHHPLYSNWTAVVYFYLHRPARDVPLLIESAQMAEFADTLRVRDGRVLEFRTPGVEYASIDSLRRVRGLRVVAERADGVVLAPAGIDARPALPPPAARRSPPP